MKFPNGFFGTGPGQGEDPQGQRDLEAYQRNRLQMTVATSTFAGVALVGMFCSCLWFICCRNSSSKTRKKPRTWAAGEIEQNNPYSYEGYLDSQGTYMQMTSNEDGGVAPYINNPLYHPNSLGADNGLPNPYSYDFNENFGLNQPGGGVQNKAQLSQLFCGTADLNPKDVPPSYTALFFATSDATATGTNNGASGSNGGDTIQKLDPIVTSIQPIHLKVTSSSAKSERKQNETKCEDDEAQTDYFNDDFLNGRLDPSTAPPVSLLSVESEENVEIPATSPEGKHSGESTKNREGSIEKTSERKTENIPPAYNPGYQAYAKF